MSDSKTLFKAGDIVIHEISLEKVLVAEVYASEKVIDGQKVIKYDYWLTAGFDQTQRFTQEFAEVAYSLVEND